MSGFLGDSIGKESVYNAEDSGSILGWKEPLKKEMVTHSSTLCLGNPMDRGAWRATVHGAAKSWTRLSN